jgi:hypothetical protein
MGPYLERPSLWPDVHAELISGIRASLIPQLRPKYSARLEDRVYISDDRDPGRKLIVPDIHVPLVNPLADACLPENGGTLLAEIEPIEATTFFHTEIHEPYITILDSQDQSVMTVIEVLSPPNKHPYATGERTYREQRHLVMESTARLIEIDLLRAGEHFPIDPRLPACDYLVHVSRKRKRPKAKLWPIRLPQRLPKIPVPLREGDPDAEIDLRPFLKAPTNEAPTTRSSTIAKNPISHSLPNSPPGPAPCCARPVCVRPTEHGRRRPLDPRRT